MSTTMDVSALVAEMHETLSTIHATLASLNTTQHDARLDELEKQRDGAVQALLATFSTESVDLHRKREARRAELAEKRRVEDEERERRRRREDEDLAVQETKEDADRDGRLDGDTRAIEDEADSQMSTVEHDAETMILEGKQKLKDLEARRRELNRLIDEQLNLPLPSAPTRVRRGTRAGTLPLVAAESKPSEPDLAGKKEQVSNGIKAHENDNTGQSEEPPRETSPPAVSAPAPVEEGLPTAADHRESSQQESTGGESLPQNSPELRGMSEAALVPLSTTLDSVGDVQRSKSGAESSEDAFDTEQEIALDHPLSNDVLYRTEPVEDVHATEDSTPDFRSSSQEKVEQKGDLPQRASNLEEKLESPDESNLSEENLDENEHRGRTQELGHGDTNDVPVVSPPTRSLFGSWGKTMRNLVSTQSMTTGDGDSTEDKLGHDRKRSMPGAFISEDPSPIPTPSETGLPVESKLPVPQLHDAEEHTGCSDQEASLVAGDGFVAEVAFGDVGEELSIPNLGKDSRFHMSGEEAIPGTMTHGSDQPAKEIPEATPGALAQPIGHSSLPLTHSQEIPELEPSPADDGRQIPSFEDHDADQGYPTEESTKNHSVTTTEQDLILQNETLDSVAEAAPRVRFQHTEDLVQEPSLEGAHTDDWNESQSTSPVAVAAVVEDSQNSNHQDDCPLASPGNSSIREAMVDRPGVVEGNIDHGQPRTLVHKSTESHSADDQHLDQGRLEYAQADPPTSLNAVCSLQGYQGSLPSSIWPEIPTSPNEIDVRNGHDMPQTSQLDKPALVLPSSKEDLQTLSAADVLDGGSNVSTHSENRGDSEKWTDSRISVEHQTDLDPELLSTESVLLRTLMKAPAEYSSDHKNDEPMPADMSLSAETARDHSEAEHEPLNESSLDHLQGTGYGEVDLRGELEPKAQHPSSPSGEGHKISDAELPLASSGTAPEDVSDQDVDLVRMDQEPGEISERRSAWESGHESYQNGQQELTDQDVSPLMTWESQSFRMAGNTAPELPPNHLDVLPKDDEDFIDYHHQRPASQEFRREVGPEVFVPPERQNHADTQPQTPMLYQAQRLSLADELDQAEEPYYGSYADGSASYEVGDVQATTVHGEDDLFDDDGNSNESIGHGTRSDSVDYEAQSEEVGQDNSRHEDAAVPQEAQSTAEEEDRSEIVATNGPPALERPDLSENQEFPSLETPTEPVYSMPPAFSTAGSPTIQVESPSAGRGLAASRHNPNRPQTPPQQQGLPRDSFDADDFLPRDVTNVPWHERTDSIPQSVRSQSTLSSSPSSSPARSLPQIDAHEPAIRDSWATPIRGLSGISDLTGRPRNDSQSTTEYDPIRLHEKQAPWWERGRSFAAEQAIEAPHGSRDEESVAGSTTQVTSSATGSPGSLFRRMRNLFENPQDQQPPGPDTRGTPSPPHFTGGGRDGTAWSGRGSPVRSRPASGVFHPPRRGPAVPGLGRDSVGLARRSISVTPIQDDGYDHPGDTKGSYLNEAEDEVDERSALLSTQ